MVSQSHRLDALLHINATSQGNFQEALRLTNSGGGANEGAFIRFEISNASAHGAIIGARRSGSGGIDLRFDTGEINGAPVTAMTIDHDQRVGIGRVPSISNSKLEVGGADNVSLINVEASGNTGGMGIGSTGLQLFHGASSKVLIGSGGMVVNEASADYDFRVESNDNENMLFVDGGNNRVGIGKAPATHPFEIGVYAQFDTGMTINETGVDADFRVESDNTSAALFVDGANGKVTLGGTTANAELYITKVVAGEVVRADNSQDNWNGVMYYSVIFGTGNNNGSTSADRHFQGYAGGAARFVVCGNGDVKNTNNSYGAISDLKLKENIVDSGSQWDDIKALRIRKYSMKDEHSDVPTQIGVIAQELEAAGMGGLVTEGADLDVDNNDLGTTTKQVTYSVLYMKAVKALQEAMERIESLESRIAALES